MTLSVLNPDTTKESDFDGNVGGAEYTKLQVGQQSSSDYMDMVFPHGKSKDGEISLLCCNHY